MINITLIIMVASNFVRDNFVRLVKFNLFHNNSFYTIIYNNLLNIEIIYCIIYIRISTV